MSVKAMIVEAILMLVEYVLGTVGCVRRTHRMHGALPQARDGLQRLMVSNPRSRSATREPRRRFLRTLEMDRICAARRPGTDKPFDSSTQLRRYPI